MENGNIGAWYPKKDGIDFVLNYESDRQMPDDYTMIKPLDGVQYQRFDDETQTWVPDPEAEVIANAKIEMEQILDGIAERDYRALKAVKLKTDLDILYPGESEWYQGKVQRVRELRQIIGEE